MSNPNNSDSADGVKEGLGKLADSSLAPSGDTPVAAAVPPAGKWDRGKRIAKRTALILGLIVVIPVFGISGYFLANPVIRGLAMSFIGKSGKVLITRDLTAPWNITNFPTDRRKSLTVLVLGSDHDTIGVRKPGHMPVPVDVMSAPGRSDAIMIAKFEFDGDAVTSLNVLSIPRDTRVRVPGHGIHKINAAHAYGGPELSCATVASVFGINPDYFVDLNFEGFQQVVDAVGGVNITVHPQANGKGLDYDDNWGKLHIHLKPGFQHLNGYRAMGYVRFRHTDNDLARAQHQHEFLEALRGQVSSPKDFMALPNVATAVASNLHSNLTMDQLLTLANLARKAPKDAICIDTLPVIEGKTFVYIDKRKGPDVVRKMFFKDKQVADLTINTPDSDASSTSHRRRRVRDGSVGSETRRRSGRGSTALESPAAARSNSTNTPPANPGGRSDGTQTDGGPASSDAPKPQTHEGPPAGDAKPASKSKDGTGTSSGVVSPVIRT